MPVIECDGALLKRARYAREVPVRARVDERGLSIDGVLTVDRARVALVVLRERAARRPLVQLYDEGARLVGEVSVDAEHAHAIARAFPTDDGRAMSFRARSRFPSGCAVVAILVFMFFFASLMYGAAVDRLDVGKLTIRLFLPVGALVAAQVVLAYKKVRVVVAADGVRAAWFGAGRFLPWTEVANVSVHGATLSLRSKTGRRLRLRARPSSVGGPHDDFFAMVERMRRVYDACASAQVHVPEALARGGRAIDAWIADLEALGKSAGYRDASVSSESLFAVLESPAAPAAARAAAAVALNASAGDRARIAAVADRTACVPLRDAVLRLDRPSQARALANA